jgi:hypothetical protein
VELSVEHGLCSKTSVHSSDDSNEIFTTKIVGDLLCIKEEDEPIAISFSSIKEEPEVSPQAFQQYLGLPSVIMLFCLLAFHINQLHLVNGIGLYIFPEYFKYEF